MNVRPYRETPLLDQPPGLRMQIWFSSFVSLLSIGMVGACAQYAISNFPFVDFGVKDQKYWLAQGVVFFGYGLMTLPVVTSLKLGNFFLGRSRYQGIWWRLLFGFIAIPLSTMVVKNALLLPLYHMVTGIEWERSFSMWLISTSLDIAAYFCLLMHRALTDQRDQTMRAQLETENLATALDRAELAMLEAQIEPHFLFNTLAHIKRQYRHDQRTADQMLCALIEYLDRAVPALRCTDWTIGDELGLIRVYLDILVHRFESRLRFSIDASDASKAIYLPALTIATLVENAVRHGLAPKPAGGTVSISAEIVDQQVRIEVSDDGVGLVLSSGSGLGLATVRARLKNAFGRAFLVVEPRQPCGVRSLIRIPLSA